MLRQTSVKMAVLLHKQASDRFHSLLTVYCSDMTFEDTAGLLRYQGFQEKCKRPTKVVKVKPKAREPKMLKF